MVEYFRILNFEQKHNNFQYSEGLNIDTNKFIKDSEYNHGLFFTNRENVLEWMDDESYWIAEVQIPKDAQVSSFEHKLKADRIILKNIMPLAKFLEENYDVEAVAEKYPHLIRYVKDPSEELINKVLKRNVGNIKFIKNQSYGLCMFVLNKDVSAIEYIENPTKEMCLMAVSKRGYLLRYIKNQTEEICIAAIEQDFNSYKHVKDRTVKIDKAMIESFIKSECCPDLEVTSVDETISTIPIVFAD